MICCWDRLVRAVWACICACKESFELFRFVCLFVLRVALVCLLWFVCFACGFGLFALVGLFVKNDLLLGSLGAWGSGLELRLLRRALNCSGLFVCLLWLVCLFGQGGARFADVLTFWMCGN
jgi:hypothetical protein